MEIRAQRARTPEAEAEIAAGTRAILAENTLNRLRAHQRVTQQEFAAALGTAQANVSLVEAEGDPQLSTVRQFVEALGGTLIVQAKIGDETIDLLVAEPPTRDRTTRIARSLPFPHTWYSRKRA